MTKQKDKHCYADLLGKMDTLDMQVNRIKQQLKELKSMIRNRTNNEDGATADPEKAPAGHITNFENAEEGEAE